MDFAFAARFPRMPVERFKYSHSIADLIWCSSMRLAAVVLAFMTAYRAASISCAATGTATTAREPSPKSDFVWR
ncbi:hypothetical protein HS088_TW13G01099 [Tripterygium wilfordii]|uniref:Uncharacterized protein n=1 Tax=Tripterygium wilfordii TaxID=458696 RepID=A0A7J7CVV7_TRIWF|nr:hypothetical protein HS088_TW13G01099 [Tripterygium wilfordii]